MYLPVHDYGIRKFKKAKKLHFEIKFEAGKPAGSITEAGSQIQAGSLIEAGSSY